MGFAERLASAAEVTERTLEAVLDGLARDGAAPARLLAATRHAVLGGGKRFRPFLVIEAAALFAGHDRAAAATVAAAVECMHAYSLVHDDLPAMDDDDLRRGRPTVHRAYDEATAILVGDGLQALAFELVAAAPVAPAAAAPLTLLLARAGGFAGMVGGQFRDLCADNLDAAAIVRLQAMKTGALIRASVEAGAIVGGASEAARTRLARYGALLGEAFQIADDLLDVEGTEEETGKRVGKDVVEGKATLAALLGAAPARDRLRATAAAAARELDLFGAEATALRQACHFVAERRS